MKIYTLENDFIRAEFFSLGATILSLTIKPLNRNVVLTNEDLEVYEKRDAAYYGATVGPVAGRIKNGYYIIRQKVVELDQNERGKHTLHGGSNGFSFQEFDVEMQTDTEIIFTFYHKEKVDNFNGDYRVRVVYTLQENGLIVEYIVNPGRDTLLNITNHSYFNLAGQGDILKHQIQAKTSGYYAFDHEQINTEFVKLKRGEALDLNKEKKLGDIIFDPSIYKAPSNGLDHLYLLSNGILLLKTTDLCLEVSTSYSGVQLYTTNYPSKYPLKDFGSVNKHHAIAIEPVDVVCGIDGKYQEIERNAHELYLQKIIYKFKLL